jgi:molybdopterin/thiamine biosynthesis adenylyltransferase
MLTRREKLILEKAFDNEKSKELTLQQVHKLSAATKIPIRTVEWFLLEKGILPLRYQRNMGIMGIQGQKILLKSRIIVVGLGGLGGYVVEESARAGIGQIVGVDPDVFESTNLNRQLLATEHSIGKKKIDKAGARIKEINNSIEFTGYSIPADKLPKKIYCNADLVFDCLDNITDRRILANKCAAADVPLVHGAIAGWYGEVAVIWPNSNLFEKIYLRKEQKKGIEQDLGTPSFTPAVTASVMVAKGIKILLGKDTDKEKKMLFFDLLQDEWQTILFS